jgi:putative methyltransferase (TIGR04325 family)
VVELASVCEDGRRLFGGDPRIQFHAALPAGLQDVDIVHAGGVIEVMEDWAGTLRDLCRLAPRYVLLTGVCCGEFRTYATGAYLVPGSVIASWQLNARAVVEVMAAHGYALVFRTLQERVHAQDNFPEALRLPDGHPSALLFAAVDPRP